MKLHRRRQEKKKHNEHTALTESDFGKKKLQVKPSSESQANPLSELMTENERGTECFHTKE